MNKKLIKLTESDLHKIIKESINMVLTERMNDSIFYGENFPASDRHPDIYTAGRKQGKKFQINYGADYGYKNDSSLLKNWEHNPNAKRTEWLWIKDMINHAKDVFSEYHLYDKDAYEAIEKLYELLKQGVSEEDAVDSIGDMFYKEE